jgi:hypothetical protein
MGSDTSGGRKNYCMAGKTCITNLFLKNFTKLANFSYNLHWITKLLPRRHDV